MNAAFFAAIINGALGLLMVARPRGRRPALVRQGATAVQAAQA